MAQDMNFALRISAQDQTRSGLRSALSGIQTFARTAIKPITIPLKFGQGAARFLRDFNQGIRPALAGMDSLIERGAGLEVQQKGLSRLLGQSGAEAKALAAQLSRAAGGTLRLGEAMQVANRALASGIRTDQLLTAIEFISKKSVTTGKNAADAVDKVITGLARGSTLFLDDFGILVDGIDGVRRSFDAIHGVKAFDQLGPAAQKAEIVRAAIAEMSEQLGRMGISGRETIFMWGSIKARVGDAVDRLALAAVKSKALRDTVRGLRDQIEGLTKHLSTGGSLGELLFGKQGGQSGGVFGLVSAGLKDIGENFGRGATAMLLDGIAGGVELLRAGGDYLAERLEQTWESARAKLIEPLLRAADKLGALLKFRGGGAPAGGAAAGDGGGLLGPGGLKDAAKAAARAVPGAIAADLLREAGGRVIQHGAGKVAAQATGELGGGIGAGLLGRMGRGGAKFLAKGANPLLTLGDFVLSTTKYFSEFYKLMLALNDAEDMKRLAAEQEKRLKMKLAEDRRRRPVGAGMGLGFGVGGPDALDMGALGLRARAQALRAGGGFGGLRAEWGRFKKDFGGRGADDFELEAARGNLEQLGLLPSRLSQKGRIALNRQLRADRRLQQRTALDTTGEIRRLAARNTDKIVKERVGQGFEVNRKERKAIFDAEFKRIQDERLKEIMDRMEQNYRALLAGTGGVEAGRRNARGMFREATAGRDAGKLDQFIEAANDVVASVRQMIGALTGASERIARAGS